jgi:hypothetical protein
LPKLTTCVHSRRGKKCKQNAIHWRIRKDRDLSSELEDSWIKITSGILCVNASKSWANLPSSTMIHNSAIERQIQSLHFKSSVEH